MLNFFPKKKYLFKCIECSTITSVEFEKKEDQDKTDSNDMILECACGGLCEVLRD
jgi:hypothetical protein